LNQCLSICRDWSDFEQYEDDENDRTTSNRDASWFYYRVAYRATYRVLDNQPVVSLVNIMKQYGDNKK
jgi:hypothetical protein